VVVRYITRAHERHEARRRLYHAVLELMHGKRAADAPAQDAKLG
jgi:RNase P protein component